MRIILFTNKQTRVSTPYSSLKPFFRDNPKFKKYKENITTYLSRKKHPFENEFIKIERIKIVV